MMFWVIQENLYNEEGFHTLLQALDRLEIPYEVVKVIPFSSILTPEPTIPEGSKVVVMGATSMTRIARERGWNPGAYFDNDRYDYGSYIQGPWGPHLLNGDGLVCRFADVPEQKDLFFIRPVKDTKTFTGTVVDWGEFATWRHKVIDLGEQDGSSLSADTRVVVAPPKVIYREYRIYIIDGKAVTGSLYKSGGRPRQDALVDDGVLRFAEARAAEFTLSRAFVLDIADTPDGLKIIEAGCINAAGYYKADIGKVVAALETLEGD